jgi:hypothetical protein
MGGHKRCSFILQRPPDADTDSALIPDSLRRSIVLEFGFLYLPYPTRYQPDFLSLAQRSVAQNTSAVAVHEGLVFDDAVQSKESLRCLWQCKRKLTLHVMLGHTSVSHHDNHSPKRALHVTDVIERAVSAQVKSLDQGTLSVRQNQPPVKPRATPDLHRHMQAATFTTMSSAWAIPTGFPS